MRNDCPGIVLTFTGSAFSGFAAVGDRLKRCEPILGIGPHNAHSTEPSRSFCIAGSKHSGFGQGVSNNFHCPETIREAIFAVALPRLDSSALARTIEGVFTSKSSTLTYTPSIPLPVPLQTTHSVEPFNERSGAALHSSPLQVCNGLVTLQPIHDIYPGI